MKRAVINTMNCVVWITLLIFMGCQSSTKNDASKEELPSEPISEPSEELKYIGQVAPSFELIDLQQNVRRLSDYKGQYLVVHFATTWCPFCNAEAPNLEQLNKDYKEKGVNVLIIDVREDKELVQKKLQDKFNFTFPILMDSTGQVATSFCPKGVQPDLPRDEVMIASNLIIDPDGKIQFFSLLDSKSFDAKLTALRERLDKLLANG